MAQIYTPQPQPNGEIRVRVNDSVTGAIVNRYVVVPGAFTAPGAWTATDISEEPSEIKAACKATWVPSVVDKWKLDHPWKEPAPVPALENISKNIIWERMTDQEAAAADNVLKAQTVKIRRIYDGATYISVRANEYPMLLGAMTQLFGAQRAAEILKPNF